MSGNETFEVSKHVGKKFRRFFQNFVSTLKGRSIPLLQPEACMFPSIFYKQLEDGSFPGALPFFFLYDDKNANSKFDFDGLHGHMRLRLKDSTLLTSSNLAYIMHAFDCFEFVFNEMSYQPIFQTWFANNNDW